MLDERIDLFSIAQNSSCRRREFTGTRHPGLGLRLTRSVDPSSYTPPAAAQVAHSPTEGGESVCDRLHCSDAGLSVEFLADLPGDFVRIVVVVPEYVLSEGDSSLARFAHVAAILRRHRVSSRFRGVALAANHLLTGLWSIKIKSCCAPQAHQSYRFVLHGTADVSGCGITVHLLLL